MVESLGLEDQAVRRLAETTFDQNVIVLAGAGTGKTTLLVNRIINGLVRSPNPLRVTEMVVLTFTNKAANELKVRLRERLQQVRQSFEGNPMGGGKVPEHLDFLASQSGVDPEFVKNRLTVALEDLGKAQIGTLHSYASHLLRLYPLESGVDPNFREDDGSKFSEIFEEVWAQWLEVELRSGGHRVKQWHQVLSRMGLQDLKQLAFSLCDDLMVLSDFEAQLKTDTYSKAFSSWLQSKCQRTQRLLAHHVFSHPRKIEAVLQVGQEIFERAMQSPLPKESDLSEDEVLLIESALGQPPKGWNQDDYQEARSLIQAASRLLRVDNSWLLEVVKLVSPFVQEMRRTYFQKGWIRFDGLLTKVRDLLRDHVSVRETIKGQVKTILVDEFQDTDPLQYEIFLYLGERLGRQCSDWQGATLCPGKLFIVGDPKQSIYGFRRADIEAFDHVVDKLKEEGAIICTLVTNFRSQESLLKVFNATFDRLFVPRHKVQPANVPLAVGRVSQNEETSQGVELCVITKNQTDEEWDGEKATRVEAEWLAGWLQDQLQPGKEWVEEGGERKPLRPGHMAVLFRKFTNAQVYLEAMQRHGLSYVTEGEKHFYRRQEVIDVVNVLRVIDDPTDALAIVGMLRSSLGGVPDPEIMALSRLGPWDVRDTEKLRKWESARRDVIHELFVCLARLHILARTSPLSGLIDEVFQELPLVELAAASSHGEQAVVNVWKLRDMLTTQTADPGVSFSGCVDRLVETLHNPPPEPEAPLAEDTLDAIRVLSIHKAKGLEFPIVVLPGLHQQSAPFTRETKIIFDWMTGEYGCVVPPIWNAGYVPLREKLHIQEQAEQRRVFYVGMTRARDRLLLSGGQLPKRGPGTFMDLLQQVTDGKLGDPTVSQIGLGSAEISQRVITEETVRSLSSIPETKTAKIAPKFSMLFPSPQWKDERKSAIRHLPITKLFLSPTSQREPCPPGKLQGEVEDPTGLSGLEIGSLVHRFLEYWEFQNPLSKLGEEVSRFVDKNGRGFSQQTKEEWQKELYEVLNVFFQSKSYQELRAATIIGREIPFSLPWTPEGERLVDRGSVMEGMIDILYEEKGEIWVGEFKTDRVSSMILPRYIEAYRSQVGMYTEATERTLGLDVKGCKLFFIRSGESLIFSRESLSQ